ncbi:MAG: glycogen debranching protein, partial [Actinomycetota bacterium]|nr:glycogen debranching protein [Actinomycetota bacterium]
STPDEQPGAMPEIFPSAPDGNPTAGIPANINRCWTCRSQVMQAWGNYGTVWSVVHQQLGVRPFLPYGMLEVVPQVPPRQPSVAGSDIRLGGGSVDVFAAHSGRRYTTRVRAHGLRLRSLILGHTLPASTSRYAVKLDGRRVRHPAATRTNRGLEITVRARGRGPHRLVITVR